LRRTSGGWARWALTAVLVAAALSGSAAAGAGPGGGPPTADPDAGVPGAKLDVILRGEEIHARQVREGPTLTPLPSNHVVSCPQGGGPGTIETYGSVGAGSIPNGRGYLDGATSSTAGGAPLAVYAGADEADPTQGVLRIDKLAADLCAAESPEEGSEFFGLGDHAGPVELVAVAGPHLTFRFVVSGCAATYDVTVRPGAGNSLAGRLAVPACETVDPSAPGVVATAGP
jgi:hypothetical protein